VLAEQKYGDPRKNQGIEQIELSEICVFQRPASEYLHQMFLGSLSVANFRR